MGNSKSATSSSSISFVDSGVSWMDRWCSGDASKNVAMFSKPDNGHANGRLSCTSLRKLNACCSGFGRHLQPPRPPPRFPGQNSQTLYTRQPPIARHFHVNPSLVS
ncbi:hypothetical protein M407DRAFT_245252 [Tulasnella calospora MUT 4182]|uniref:Uncharacterized protein n=1 Tax=Tulasnella calospora MUT 4182 TaxID=1051891 RepID=A0A0C3QB23_9AGAM|nr:hypothetical protein M407DRAFT_245252 [Tulasnella calospora MUT 4182]